jgi:DNA polymerase III epsilon subunit-like protein
MGLVFGSIILLWGVMALLTSLTSRTEQGKTGVEAELLHRAAVAAVATALAREAALEPHEFPLPPTAIVSAWQAVNRTNMLNKRGQIR